MGLFSDADIDEVWEFAQGFVDLTYEQKLNFIKSFEEGWKLLKKFKHSFSEKAYFNVKIVDLLKDGIRGNPKDFGKALGAFIGTIRFDPEKLVLDSIWTEECVRYLNSQSWIFKLYKWKNCWMENMHKGSVCQMV